MKFAYADPPYIGCAKLYEEKQEVDHEVLIGRLMNDFPDGWALSCHTPSLKYLLSVCPEKIRILAWTKPMASFKKGVRPGYAWEPVLMFGGRKQPADEFYVVRDWMMQSPVVFRGEDARLKGVKSIEFCRWILACLGFEPGDEVVDMFPGTRIMEAAMQPLPLVWTPPAPHPELVFE